MKKKTIITLSIILLIIIILSSSTYAFLNIQANSGNITSTAGCLNIKYNGEEGEYISAENSLVTSDNYTEGGSSKVTFSKSEDCDIYEHMNIYLYTNEEGTSKDLLSEGALKYTVLDNNQTIIGQGEVKNIGAQLLKTVPLTKTDTTYTVYTWVDKNITSASQKQYSNLTYSGYIYSEANQTSTFNGLLIPDISYNTNNAQAIGATIDKTKKNITTDGIDDYIDCKLSNYPFENSISMVLRVKLNELSTDTSNYLFGNWNNEGLGNGIWLDSNHSLKSDINISEQNQTISTPNDEINPNTWYTIISTYDGTNFKLYINGIEKAQTTITTENKNITPNSAPFSVSSKLNTENLQDNFTNATYSDILLYKRALTQEEITSISVGEIESTNVDKTDLLFYYDFS